MRAESDSSLMKIGRRAFFELPDGYCDSVRCMEGLLWITEYGSSQDCVLGPGQSLRLDDRHRVLIQGLQPSTLRLTRNMRRTAAPHGIWQALAARLDRLDPLHRHGLLG